MKNASSEEDNSFISKLKARYSHLPTPHYPQPDQLCYPRKYPTQDIDNKSEEVDREGSP